VREALAEYAGGGGWVQIVQHQLVQPGAGRRDPVERFGRRESVLRQTRQCPEIGGRVGRDGDEARADEAIARNKGAWAVSNGRGNSRASSASQRTPSASGTICSGIRA
jgi:hypothetical protein